MKNRFLTIVFLALFVLGGQPSFSQEEDAGSEPPLKLTLIPSKPSYQVGEVADFQFVFSNPGSGTVTFLDELDDYDYLHIQISKDDGNFRENIFRRKAMGDRMYVPSITLNPGESITRPISILWNLKTIFSKDAAQTDIDRITAGRLMTWYAFQESGTYKVKASYHISFVNAAKGTDPLRVESEPVQITITEAKGEDLELWNIFKDSGDFAGFLQDGEIMQIYTLESLEKFQTEVESIIERYPKSLYTPRLKLSLEKLKAQLKSMKESKERWDRNRQN